MFFEKWDSLGPKLERVLACSHPHVPPLGLKFQDRAHPALRLPSSPLRLRSGQTPAANRSLKKSEADPLAA
jgi:hypothetical protein